MLDRTIARSSSVGTRCAVVIASAGRASTLAGMLEHLEEARPDGSTVIVSVPDARSLPDQLPNEVVVVTGTTGAAAQRNRGVEVVPADADIIFFFDDDTLPHPDYFQAMVTVFDSNPDCVGLTGELIRDGAVSGPLSREEGLALLQEPPRKHRAVVGIEPIGSLYGCNFAARAAALRHEQFDERLPLYSWLEDEDLSQRLRRRGFIGLTRTARCVHLAVPSGGRADHLRFGYSQVANAIYLRSKGSVSRGRTFWLLRRPISANLIGSISGTARSWRRRRLAGNFQALRDVLRGQVRPEQILNLPRG